MSALRRTSFLFPHPNPIVRLSLAEHSNEVLDRIADEEVAS